MNLLCIKIWCLRFVIFKIYILPPDGSGAYTVFLFKYHTVIEKKKGLFNTQMPVADTVSKIVESSAHSVA